MDSVSDKEVGEIWERMKKDIPVSELKAKTKNEFISNLERKMNDIDKNKIQVKILLNAGFPERLAAIKGKQFFEVSEQPKKPFLRKFKLTFLIKNKIKLTKLRISIKIKNRFKSYKKENIIVTKSTYKGKKAYYVFNSRLHKRISWGLIK